MPVAVKKDDYAVFERGGAALLAAQPTNDNFSRKPEIKITPEAWQKLQGHNEQRLNSLRNWRNSWWMTSWADLAQFINPRRSIWLTQGAGGIPSPNGMLRGLEINQAIVDPTGTYALRTCSAGIVNGLASVSKPWFKMTTVDRNFMLSGNARRWLDTQQDRMYDALARSNFYDSFAQECEDDAIFGTAPVIIYEDLKDIFRCYNPCVGEYYLSSDGTLRNDGLYRAFVMTIAQIVGFFGLENCPEEVQQAWRQGGSQIDAERIVAHAIEPNFAIQGNEGTKVKGEFTWRETYWLYGVRSTYPMVFRGYRDQPFTVSRWSKQSNDAYGRSVGMDILPDVIQLQIETRRKGELLEKIVRPPMLASMSMKNQPSSQLPGKTTYVPQLTNGDGMRSMYELPAQAIAPIVQDIAQIQQRILKGGFADLFLMLENAPQLKMTAYEVAQKQQEKLQVLGPVIENKMEQLRLKLHRIFAIMKRRGFIDPIPDDLRGVPIGIEFTSLLAQAQKAAAMSGIERQMALVGNASAVYGQEATDNMDIDSVLQTSNQLLGNPESIMRGPEAKAQMRANRAKQQNAATSMEAAQHGAKTAGVAADAANVLSQTQIGGGKTALAQMMGAG